MTHRCHWPGCEESVPPALWGCKFHWFKLPINLRNLIYMYYLTGQETRRNPSPEYLIAASVCQLFALKSSSCTLPKNIKDNQTKINKHFIDHLCGQLSIAQVPLPENLAEAIKNV